MARTYLFVCQALISFVSYYIKTLSNFYEICSCLSSSLEFCTGLLLFLGTLGQIIPDTGRFSKMALRKKLVINPKIYKVNFSYFVNQMENHRGLHTAHIAPIKPLEVVIQNALPQLRCKII